MRWPVDKPRVTPHGGYMFHRTSSRFCNGKPPCDHHGLDLGGKRGTPVYAPESGVLVFSFAGDKVKPFSRFGPAGVVIRGAKSGMYHLLMHLAAPTVFAAQQSGGKATRLPGTIAVLEGQQLGVIGKDHVHWEMRRAPTDRASHVDPVVELVRAGVTVPLARARSSPKKTGGDVWLLAILLGLVATSRR